MHTEHTIFAYEGMCGTSYMTKVWGTLEQARQVAVAFAEECDIIYGEILIETAGSGAVTRIKIENPEYEEALRKMDM